MFSPQVLRLGTKRIESQRLFSTGTLDGGVLRVRVIGESCRAAEMGIDRTPAAM